MARQNALSALTIALGELQKYAGPDQRTTAPAEIVIHLGGIARALFERLQYQHLNQVPQSSVRTPLIPRACGT